MSGILGFLQNSTNDNFQKYNLKTMLLWNRSYGKDAESISTHATYALGGCYERLSKESEYSTTVLSKGKRYATIDALLFNREEMLQKINLHKTISDEELLFSYVNTFGYDALKDVNGDFAGAIYDDNKKALVLFRDHMGVRPIFYYACDEFITFSTDIRGIISLPQVDASISENWIYKTLAGHSTLSQSTTEYAHIFCVNPASYIQFSYMDNILVSESHKYWELGSKKIRFSSEAAYKDKLRDLITDAVKIRLDVISDQVGAELSGGLDSGIIDILIHRLGRKGIYFSWSVNPDELPLAKNDERLIIADICEQENISCLFRKMNSDLSNDSNIARNIQDIGINLSKEHPAFQFVLPPYINTLPICEASQVIQREGAKVVFTGHGGDEGVSHRCNPYELFYHREYYHFFRYMWSTTHGQRNRIRKTLKKSCRVLWETRRKLKNPFLNPFLAPDLLNIDFSNKFGKEKMSALHFAYDPKSYINEGGSRNRLDNVALLGSYSGVRYLIPYLDYRVIDYAVSIPRYLYLKGNKNRYIFREAFKDIMPKSLYNLRTKEDNSDKNKKDNPNWFEEFKQKKIEVISKLDRKSWEKYLDFDVIDKWMMEEKPSEEKRFESENKMFCLFMFAVAENLVKKSREIS
jgi:asparagine synthase (glutamine-hydrolysing)